ncbi:MAG TPA: N,N-dimethylformamidase beta subunit family domain-containing protein [Mycobacterium sp.]|nr:N,N-dimethylformamidase beta subunit family domain-containing protein [Mycobacterium sp.]
MTHLPSRAIYGYAPSFSVAAGESISFHVSTHNVAEYRADVVRLHHGIDVPGSPGLREEEVPADINGRYPGAEHATWCGSYVEVPDPTGALRCATAMTMELSLYPTLLDRDRQAVIGSWDTATEVGVLLALEHGRLVLHLGGESRCFSVGLERPLEPFRWYAISAGFDLAAGTRWLSQTPAGAFGDRANPSASSAAAERAEAEVDLTEVTYSAPFRIGAASRRSDGRWWPVSLYNGKIGNPRIADSDENLLAAWDFAASDRSDGALLQHVEDTSGHGLHGVAVNAPTRGVTGMTWRGVADDFRSEPSEYGAIHFHEDDLEDARWPAAAEWSVPPETASGVYALRLRADGYEEHIPFVVTPAAGRPRATVALLLPTGSYLAYANDRLPVDADGAELLIGHVPVLQREDLELQAHYDFGRSCYELHPDGSGVVFSSRRRPILNMRPRYLGWFMASGPWQLPADLCIVDWLDQTGIEYDVITDEDLHREGFSLLDGYRVVLTGSHPEYISTPEIEAVERYLASGGRLMYLGGNGFYWRVSYDPERPHLMEVRRSVNGSRPNTAAPGEDRHSSTGEKCGLWRNLGRSPQRLLGVGMGSEGFDYSVPYTRLPDSYQPATAFVFDGVTGDVFGDYGVMGGGAAGAELDRYDIELGSPPEAFVLATSVGRHSDNYQEASEDLFETPPTTGGSQSLAVRSDVVYFPVDGGGAVFSVGSIAWTGALSHNGYENDIARITKNVLRQFADT